MHRTVQCTRDAHTCPQRCPYHALNLCSKASLLSGFHMIIYKEEDDEEDDQPNHDDDAPGDIGSHKSEKNRCAMVGEKLV